MARRRTSNNVDLKLYVDKDLIVKLRERNINCSALFTKAATEHLNEEFRVEKFTWNEVQVLRGLIFEKLEKNIDEYTKDILFSSLEKIDQRRIELQKNMEST